MGDIIKYSNSRFTRWCLIKLDSGELIHVSVARSGVRISKMKWGGLIPGETIYESDDIKEMVHLFATPSDPFKHPLDAIVDYVLACKSIPDLKYRLGKG